ncbi:unnamed protein product, partial [Brassica rapa subsp. trilocularis]
MTKIEYNKVFFFLTSIRSFLYIVFIVVIHLFCFFFN